MKLRDSKTYPFHKSQTVHKKDSLRSSSLKVIKLVANLDELKITLHHYITLEIPIFLLQDIISN